MSNYYVADDDLFITLYRAIGACEAPEGTQVDDVLANFQDAYNRLNAERKECWNV